MLNYPVGRSGIRGGRAARKLPRSLDQLSSARPPLPDPRYFRANCVPRYGMESLERLQGLYEDLVAFSETRLANVERLWLELEASIDDFRKLLDKPPKNNASRESLATGIDPFFFLIFRPLTFICQVS